ncbi:hypothetical protein VTI28DRAFT_5438 [Corynascus sepedonium]
MHFWLLTVVFGLNENTHCGSQSQIDTQNGTPGCPRRLAGRPSHYPALGTWYLRSHSRWLLRAHAASFGALNPTLPHTPRTRNLNPVLIYESQARSGQGYPSTRASRFKLLLLAGTDWF